MNFVWAYEPNGNRRTLRNIGKKLCIYYYFFYFQAILAEKAKKDDPKKVKDCHRVCPTAGSGRKPYCGTDGVTYPNRCELNKARCLATKNGTSIDAKHRGPCGNEVKKGKKRQKRCSDVSRCKSVNSTKRAVCGSDNTTYPTYCHFRIAACQALMKNESLTLLYRSECGKMRVPCPKFSECDKVKKQVCGSNGKTYRNTCYFSIAKCRAKKNKQRIRVQSRGELSLLLLVCFCFLFS